MNMIIINNFHTARAKAAARPPSVLKQTPLAKQFCQRPNHKKKFLF